MFPSDASDTFVLSFNDLQGVNERCEKFITKSV
jgi:hypothetical protein